MSLSRGELNPLGILKMRKLNFIPKHFSKISTENFLDVKLLDHWIAFNLNSRYAIKRQYIVDSDNKMLEVLEIGIEDPKEITLLTLGCPYLHNSN
jgi:hypothetical protein